MDFRFNNIEIVGMSCAVPKKIIDNTENADESIMRILNVTGITRRRTLLGTGLRLVDLAIISAKDAIKKACISVNDIKVLIYVTGDPEFANPPTAFYIQKELGINIDCFVTDLNFDCPGYVYGAFVASSVLNSLEEENCFALLITGADLTYQDRSFEHDKLLFGDASSATILKKTSSYNSVVGSYFSDGNRYKCLYRKDFNSVAEMDGDTVFHFSITDVPKGLVTFMEKNAIDDSNVDFFAIHQAQKFIVDKLAAKSKINKAKILYSLDEFANTGSVSIPLTVCHNKNMLHNENKILMCAFGMGLVWGYMFLDLKNDVVNEIIEL